MIGYLKGSVLQYETDGILLLSGSVGYEVLLNPIVLEKLKTRVSDDRELSFYIYYHQTERQPKPVLIGFESMDEKQFFQLFITVDAIGPMKAVKAMSRPIDEIAYAIEKKEVSFLTGLPGIGKRTAEKMIATLHGKTEKYALQASAKTEAIDSEVPGGAKDIVIQVTDVLVNQLGHSHASAKRMISEAFKRNQEISSPEALFDEIYQEDR